MKKKLLILGLLMPLFIVGCSTDGGNSGSSYDSSNTSESGSSSSSSQGVVAVTGVSLNRTTLELSDNDSGTSLTATVSPSNATNKSVTWSSSNSLVASVSANGFVTPRSVGRATITVTTVDGNKTATCNVTVSEAIVVPDYVVHIKRSGSSVWTDEDMQVNSDKTSEYYITGLSLNSGDEFKIHMYGSTWYGANDLKNSIPSGLVGPASSDGNIVVYQSGTYDIYSDYNTSDNGHIYLARNDSPSPGVVHVTEILLNRSSRYLNYHNEYTLVPTIFPTNATNKKVYWESSDTTIATVTSGGRVVAKEKTGSTTITARTEDGNKIDRCVIYCSSSYYAPYCLTGTINGNSRIYEAANPYKAVPLGDGTYVVSEVPLKSGDQITVTDNHGTTLKVGTSVYRYNVSYNGTVDVHINPNDSGHQYVSINDRRSREIYVSYPSNTNNDGLCGWLWVSGDDITPKWVKSSSLHTGSTGSIYIIPKHAEQFTFIRASKTATPVDGDYSSIGTSYRTVGPRTLYDNVHDYDVN